MTTHEPPDPAGPPREDGLDPRIAGWLAVEPLDEVTRSRLVRNALAGSEDALPGEAVSAAPRRRPGRALAVAAAVVVVLAVGIAVLVPRTEESAPTAADAPTPKVAPEAGRAPASDSPGAAALSEVAPVPLSPLGDLGDVSTAARLRAQVGSRLDPRTDDSVFVPRGCAFAAARSIGTPVAAGTGSVEGKPATVILVERPDGREAAVAVVDGSCAVGPSVTLR